MKKVIKYTKNEQLFDLKDKLVLIIGAGGLGYYIGKGMADNGAKVIFTNTSQDKADAVKLKMQKDGYSCETYVLDITNQSKVDTLVEAIAEKFGRLDVLINASGVCAHADPEKYTEEKIKKVVDVNFLGAMYASEAAARIMIKNNYGKIINIGSIAGLLCHTYKSMPYEASKAAVHMMTKSMAVTWAKYNINVNCIAPTWIRTPMVTEDPDSVMDEVDAQHECGRMAEVEDFLGLAIFLSTSASDFISGQTIYVDGAWSCGKTVNLKDSE